MQLTYEERFALEKIFHGDSDFDRAVVDQLQMVEVVERDMTGIGFFSTVRFPGHLPDNRGRLQWDWNFNHRDLSQGGSFMASYEEPDIIELEAVAFYGEWPLSFDADAFSAS